MEPIPGITIIGLLGRPGAGKGIQSRMLSQQFHLAHVSIEDTLRAEMLREGSEYAPVIRENMLAGTIGPKEITVNILRSYITKHVEAETTCFVLDGFPRDLDQAEYFERVVGPLKQIIVLACSEDTCTQRLLPRGRFDDNQGNIRRRLATFEKVTGKVIEYYLGRHLVKYVSGEEDAEAVSEVLRKIFAEHCRSSPVQPKSL